MRIKQRTIGEHRLHSAAIPPVLQRIYAGRGITDEAQLDKQLQTLLPFNSLKGLIRLASVWSLHYVRNNES